MNKIPSPNLRILSNQSGAVLIVSLMLLIMLTMLGISTMESTKLQTRMAANMADYNYAFQISEIGVEIPRGYAESDITDITASTTDKNKNIGVLKPLLYGVSRKTIGNSNAKASVQYVTAKADLSSESIQDISGAASCGVNSGCNISFLITKSMGQSDENRANSPSVTIYGGLRLKSINEEASGVTRVTDY